jgi:hypothetical protein
MSVVMRKCVTAYQDDTTPSRIDATITSAACLLQKPIVRTTDEVIIFMRLGGLEWIARMSGCAGGAGFQALREGQNGGE